MSVKGNFGTSSKAHQWVKTCRKIGPNLRSRFGQCLLVCGACAFLLIFSESSHVFRIDRSHTSSSKVYNVWRRLQARELKGQHDTSQNFTPKLQITPDVAEDEQDPLPHNVTTDSSGQNTTDGSAFIAGNAYVSPTKPRRPIQDPLSDDVTANSAGQNTTHGSAFIAGNASVSLMKPRRPIQYHLPDHVIADSSGQHTIHGSAFIDGKPVSPTKRRRPMHTVSGLRRAASRAWKAGRISWRQLEALSNDTQFFPRIERRMDIACPKSIFLDRAKIEQVNRLVSLPCGLTTGSSITLVGVPRSPHIEFQPPIGHTNDESVEVSQFTVEFQGSKRFNEEPTRILHFNPRLKGDWSDKPVIELNSFHNGGWGKSQRCDGSSSDHHETVEGFLMCEKWSDANHQENDSSSWWFTRLVGKSDKPQWNWPYPFVQNRSFIMTVRAGLEGYHVNVDGRHVTSFPYSAGFPEEAATSAYVRGDVDLQAFVATSLPSTPPKTLDEQLFENWEQWRAPKLEKGPIDLFIGVLSANNHFAERMAVRQTWFQSEAVQSGQVVARFFVALHADMDINLQVKKEAEYYGDMVISPFLDHYDLVVLKTIAICEYGIWNLSTKYIMKSDDDTFVRVDVILNALKSIVQVENLYLGNMNRFHRPLRTGKWAVSFEEWPDEVYPTYADGAGYIISHKIARFIVSQNRKRLLELFKMEDVSMGLWVKQFHQSRENVQIAHSWRFYQAGCEDGYVAAHYQLPGQMLCLWKKLQAGEAVCCNGH